MSAPSEAESGYGGVDQPLLTDSATALAARDRELARQQMQMRSPSAGLLVTAVIVLAATFALVQSTGPDSTLQEGARLVAERRQGTPSALAATPSSASAADAVATATDTLEAASTIVVRGGVAASGHNSDAMSPTALEVRSQRGYVPADSALDEARLGGPSGGVSGGGEAAAAATETTAATTAVNDDAPGTGGSLSLTRAAALVEGLVGPSSVEGDSDDRMSGPGADDDTGDLGARDGALGASPSGPAAGVGPADDDAVFSGVMPMALGVRVYDPLYGEHNSLKDHPWNYVAPPFRETRLDGFIENDFTSGPARYVWTIDSHPPYVNFSQTAHTNPEAANLMGQNQTYTFRFPGTTYTVKVKAELENEVKISTSFPVMCKYVRRELRTLTDADRELFLSALEVAHRIDDVEYGRRVYGPKFSSVGALTAKHLDATTLNKCSPYYNGLSFVTSHAAFTLELEQTLQAIDPSIAMPYWDYTQDAESYGGGGAWRESSELFQDDWFGTAAPKNDNHHLDSGRFAYLPVSSISSVSTTSASSSSSSGGDDAGDDSSSGGGGRFKSSAIKSSVAGAAAALRAYGASPASGSGDVSANVDPAGSGTSSFSISTPERNAYGVLTDSFNADPSAYVTRWSSVCSLPTKASLPDCVALQGTLQTRSLSDFAKSAERSLHGDVFALLGGAWDCRYSALDAMRAQPALHPQLMEAAGLKFATLWRAMLESGPLVCPTSCNASTPFASCSCSCPSFDPIDGLSEKAVYDALDDAGIFSELHGDGFGYLERAESATAKSGFRYTVSGLSSSQGNEFFKYLLSTLCHPGKLAPASSYHAGTNDPLFWVIHANIDRTHAWMRADSDPITGAATFDETWDTTNETSCAGHGYHDVLPFRNFMQEEEPHDYTNQQLHQLTHPHNPALPYMYDSFTWSHCADTVKPSVAAESLVADASGAVAAAEAAEDDEGDDDDKAQLLSAYSYDTESTSTSEDASTVAYSMAYELLAAKKQRD